MKQLLFIMAFCLPVLLPAQPAQTAEVLPGFQVKAAANGVTLSWNATDETHLHSYVVEYSSDGQTFSDMGMVKPTGLRAYEMLHANPFNNSNYYRIRLNHADGPVAVSETRQVAFTTPAARLSTWTSASGRELFISFGAGFLNREVEATILSAAGVPLRQVTFSNTALTEKIELDNLVSGFYMLRIAQYGEVKVLRAFVKN